MRDLHIRTAILAGPGRISCTGLAANISERQCLVNQAVAGARVQRQMYTGRLAVCLDCAAGREAAARHPEGLEVERLDVYGIPKQFKGGPRPAAAPPPPEPEKAEGMENTLPPEPEPQAGDEIGTTGETPVPLTPAPLGGVLAAPKLPLAIPLCQRGESRAAGCRPG